MPFSSGTYTRTKTFQTGGANLLPADLNNIQDDLGNSIAAQGAYWKTTATVGGTLIVGAAGTYALNQNMSGTINTFSTSVGAAMLYLDPANDWGVGTSTTQMRFRVNLLTNANAPATTFQFNLCQILTTAGTGPSDPVINTVGAAVLGLSFVTPAADTRNVALTSTIPAPLSNYYMLQMVITANMAAASSIVVKANIQYRQV